MSKFPDEYILDGGLWRLEDEASTIAYTDTDKGLAFALSPLARTFKSASGDTVEGGQQGAGAWQRMRGAYEVFG